MKNSFFQCTHQGIFHLLAFQDMSIQQILILQGIQIRAYIRKVILEKFSRLEFHLKDFTLNYFGYLHLTSDIKNSSEQ